MASSMICFRPTPTINSVTITSDPISMNKAIPILNQSFPNLSSHTYNPLQSRNTNSRPRNQSMASKLAIAWREIHGLNNWENLVEPLDPLLRQEIIRYGELVAACYKAFDLDPTSKRYLNCKYGKRSMFTKVGLAESGYEVTKYIYATAPNINIPIQTGPESPPCGARWVGYVATSTDAEVATLGRRDIVITFRGTVTHSEWMANLMSSLTPARLDPHDPRPEVKVESGFLGLYTSCEGSTAFGLQSCRDQLLSEISRLIKKHKNEEISITISGHSMGSSLAHLLAYDIAELGLNNPSCRKRDIPVTVFSFGGPRVGNTGFKERCEELGVKVLRVVNVNDPVTKMPGVVFNENFQRFRGIYEFPWSCSCYAHVGVELLVDFFKMHDPSCVHDLENYIGLLRCPKGPQKNRRGPNLVDRAKGFLAGNVLNLVQSQWT